MLVNEGVKNKFAFWSRYARASRRLSDPYCISSEAERISMPFVLRLALAWKRLQLGNLKR